MFLYRYYQRRKNRIKTFQKIILKLIISAILWTLANPLAFAYQSLPLSKNLPKKKILKNGLTLIYQKDESSAITALHIFIQGGKKAEPLEKRGLSYLTSRLAVEIPDRGKVQALMSLASLTSLSSKGDYTFIKIACLSEALDETLKIMLKIMTDPLFSGLRINWIKERMLNNKKTEEDNPLNVAHNAHLETLLAEKNYGGSVFGSEDSLNKIEKKDIVNFYKNYFRGGNMIAAVSSNLEEEELLKICTKYLKEFPEGTPPQSKLESLSRKEERKIFLEKETKQSVVSLAFPLPKLTTRNFTLAFLLETLLGKGVGSKLWPLRSKEKLAYNVNARATSMIEGGILEAYLETDNKKKETAMEALKKVIDELFEEGLTEEELEVTKIQSKAMFLRDNETKEAKTLNLAAFEALGLGYEFLNNFFKEIDEITIEEINAYIRDFLDPEKGMELIVGPKDKQK